MSRFIIVSNARSGSTWLTGMVGELPDTYTDFEFKWKPTYEPHPIHQVFESANDSILERLSSFSMSHTNIGSKFVLDPRHHSIEEYSEMRGAFDKNLTVIHLVRDLRDVFLSVARGNYVNQISTTGRQRSDKVLITTLKEQTASNNSNPLPRHIDYGHCSRLLRNLVNNDIFLSRLKDNVDNYIRVDYESLNNELEGIASTLGIKYIHSDIQRIINDPIVVRMPKLRDTEIVENIEELNDIIQAFSEVRESALAL